MIKTLSVTVNYLPSAVWSRGKSTQPCNGHLLMRVTIFFCLRAAAPQLSLGGRSSLTLSSRGSFSLLTPGVGTFPSSASQ